LIAELHARIRGYEENMNSIAKQQEEKEQEYEDMYQKLIYKDEQLFQAEQQLQLFQEQEFG
jgi:hypothetical protein